MARLLDKPLRSKTSKSEAKGTAKKKLALKGSLGVVEAADYLGIHKYTLREYISNGFVDTMVIGKRHTLDEMELERLESLLSVHGSLAKAMAVQGKEGQ